MTNYEFSIICIEYKQQMDNFGSTIYIMHGVKYKV